MLPSFGKIQTKDTSAKYGIKYYVTVFNKHAFAAYGCGNNSEAY